MKNGFYIDQNKRVLEARDMLLAESPFYASILLNLKMVETKSVKTFSVNSTELCYNAEFAKQWPIETLKVILIHEIMHLIYRHPQRGKKLANYNHNDWNISADLSINSSLWHKNGFPNGALVPGHGDYANFPMGLSAEEYYKMLMDARKKNEEEDKSQETASSEEDESPEEANESEGDDELHDEEEDVEEKNDQVDEESAASNVFGDFEEPDETDDFTEEDDRITRMVCQAIAACEEAGEDIPGMIKREMSAMLPKPKVPWKAVLRNCISEAKRSGTNWNIPCRRNTTSFIMPSRKVKQIGNVIFAVDVSGSIDKEMYEKAASEFINSLSVAESIDMWFWDTKIQATHKLTKSTDLKTITIPGGGGTSVRCVFDKIKKEHLKPKLLVVFSDMWFFESFNEVEAMIKSSGVKVLWINQGSRDIPTNFGQHIKLNECI